MRDNIKQLRQLADQILIFSYIETKAAPINHVVDKDVMKAFNLSEGQLRPALNYLHSRNLIKRHSFASSGITPEGVLAVESQVVNEETSIPHMGTSEVLDFVKALQSKRNKFLLAIYELSNGIPRQMITMRDILENLDWQQGDEECTENFLKAAEYIEGYTMGGINRTIGLTSFACEKIELALKMAEEEEAKAQRQPTPWMDTEDKIAELKRIREESIVNGKVTIPKTKACELVGIDPKTAKKHAFELYKNWNNWEL